MKKFYAYLFAAVALFGFAACSDDSVEEEIPSYNEKESIYVSRGEEATRVMLGEETEDGRIETLWSADDNATVFYSDWKSENYDAMDEHTTVYRGYFNLTEGAGTPNAKFELDGNYEEYSNNSNYYAFRPGYHALFTTFVLNANYNIDLFPGEYSFLIEFRTSLGKGNLEGLTNYGFAYSENKDDFSVRNLASILKFRVEAACNEIVINSNNELNGETYIVGIGNDFRLVDNGTAEEDNRKMTFASDSGFEPGVDYYVMVRPGEHKLSVSLDGYVSKEASKAMELKRNVIYNLGTLPAPKAKVYVLAKDLGWNNVYMVENNSSTTLSTKETIGKYTYFVAEIAPGTHDLIFRNGTTGSNYMVEVNDLVISGDTYLRLSPRGAIEINPNDESTFGYTIYVWDQKSKNVAPNLYVWEDENAFLNYYGSWTYTWGGTAFKSDAYYKPANAQNWKHYYYYVIPPVLYPTSAPFKFIVNKKGQTSDIAITGVSSDLYIGYWYDNSSSNGFWINGSSPYKTPLVN